VEPKVILQLCPVASFLNSDAASVLVLLVDTALFEHYLSSLNFLPVPGILTAIQHCLSRVSIAPLFVTESCYAVFVN
jgi:hypothetical protein